MALTNNTVSIGWSTKVSIVTDTHGTIDMVGYSGGLNEQQTPVHMNMVDVGFLSDNDSITKVISADGTKLVDGSFTFDVDLDKAFLLLDFCLSRRKSTFEIDTATEQLQTLTQAGCYWNQLSLSCSAGGLVNGSLGLNANQSFVLEDLEDPIGSFSDITSSDLVPYWQTGNEDVFSWSINLTQMLTPTYLNTQSFFPTYFRVGPWELALEIETLRHPHKHKEVAIKLNNMFKFLQGLHLTRSTNFGVLGDAGRHKFSFTAHATPSSTQDVGAIRQSVYTIE